LKDSSYVTPKARKEAEELEYNECARHSVKKNISQKKSKKVVPFNPLDSYNTNGEPYFGFGLKGVSMDEESYGRQFHNKDLSALKDSCHQLTYDSQGGKFVPMDRSFIDGYSKFENTNKQSQQHVSSPVSDQDSKRRLL